MSQADDAPLHGVRVLDLADAGGAFAGRLLAALGADVVLVEPPGGGSARRYGDAFFAFHAAGKRSVVDATTERTLVRRLAAVADVLIASGGLDVAVAPAQRPSLVRACVTPYGRDGPSAAWHGADLVAQAAGGMLRASGRPDGPPLQALGFQAHDQAGIFAAIGVVAALIERDRTGRGRDVDVSVHASVAASVEHEPDRPDTRLGRLHRTRLFHVGHGRDGYCLHATAGDWTTLVEWMKADGMAADLGDPHYEDPAVRRDEALHLFATIEAWARRYGVEELAAAAQLRRLPFAAVRRPDELFRDEQLLARRWFVECPAGRPFPGPPFRLGALPKRFARAPAPDEDRDGVVQDWLGARVPDGEAKPDDRGPADGRPLRGVRVLDLTRLIAGPVATGVLAALGADVVKLEHPRTPARAREEAPAFDRGKRSIVVDLATAPGAALARELAARADVVADNFSARVMENLGLDHPALRTLRPDVICLRMTGFGLTGPHRDHVSYGPTLHARAGYTALMTDVPGEPVGFGFSYVDFASGHLAALAVLAALHRRGRTGEGALVDFSQLEAAAFLVGPALVEIAGGASMSEIGNGPQGAPRAPHGVYRAAGDDEWIAIAVRSDDEWRRLATAMGDPPWTADARFASTSGRVRASRELGRHVAAWMRSRDARTVAAHLDAAGVAASRVVGRAELGAVRPPFRFSGTEPSAPAPPPLPGEHTRRVLAEILGLEKAAIDALEATGVARGARSPS